MRFALLATAAAVLTLALAACVPAAPPLRGAVVPAHIPSTALPPVYRHLVFTWSYADDDIRARGEGSARVAPPDSVRLDFFLGNGGLGGGRAVLIDDSLSTPGRDVVRRYLPPVPLLWAALGRLNVPEAPDTVARVDGDTLHVEIGRNPAWRATFVGNELRRLDLIDGGRIPDWVARDPGGHIHYEHARARRTLNLVVTRVDTVSAFNATIWQ